MTKDDGFALIKNALEAVLPVIETYARHAKNPPAKKVAQARAKQIRAALKAAEEVT